jgi:hypothetical protein
MDIGEEKKEVTFEQLRWEYAQEKPSSAGLWISPP